MKKQFLIFFLIFSCFYSCEKQEQKYKIRNHKYIEPVIDSIARDTFNIWVSALEYHLIQNGLIDIMTLDRSFHIDLRYSTNNNFLGKDMYGDFSKAYLQPDVAQKLVVAQRKLKELFPAYSLIIFDAARPLHIQKKMWDSINVEAPEKTKYLSNPKYGSLHNYGAAVDLSIVNEKGKELDMGTPYDFFGELAYPVKEKILLEQGKLLPEQVENRKLLRNVMKESGFFNIQTEWWHFNSCYRNEAKIKYKIIL